MKQPMCQGYKEWKGVFHFCALDQKKMDQFHNFYWGRFHYLAVEGRTPTLLSPYQAGFQPNLNLIYSLTHRLLISRQAVLRQRQLVLKIANSN